MALPSRQFIEDCAHSFVVESQPETVFVCKLLDLRLSIFFFERPEPLQVRLVNGAMLPFAALQFAFDLARESFHTYPNGGAIADGLWRQRSPSGNQKRF
jgi:hypothetical protein